MGTDLTPQERVRTISIPPIGLEGLLGLPTEARGIVLFAHGSGSGRFSPRNNFVARALREAGLATLLFDLLTTDEAQDRRNVFDIELLAQRLSMAAAWVRDDIETASPPIGYFGASTGAAAALGSVRAPTLLIVGGDDVEVLALNRAALAELRCKKELVVVPGAMHLFEEPGTLDAVVEHARGWFSAHFGEVGT